MQFMKALRMVAIIMLVATASYMMYQHYCASEKAEVAIKKTCLGLCDQNKEENNFGISTDSLEEKPMLAVSQYHDNTLSKIKHFDKPSSDDMMNNEADQSMNDDEGYGVANAATDEVVTQTTIYYGCRQAPGYTPPAECGY